MLILYDKQYEKIGEIEYFTLLEWVRRYSVAGEFTLTMPFTDENKKLLAVGHLIYYKPTKETAMINSLNVIMQNDGTEQLQVKGLHLLSLLSDRFSATSHSGDIRTLANNLINTTIVSPSNPNRKISNFIIKSFPTTGINVQVETGQQAIYQTITEQCEIYNVGAKIDFNISTKVFEFSLYQGTDRNVTFDRDFNNILEQDYFYSEASYKNTLVSETATYFDNNIGIDRKEVFADSENQAQAQAELLQYKKIEILDCVINPISPQFEYLKDYDLGDIVTVKNGALNIKIQKNIEEIKETYDRQGLHLTVVFGDLLLIKRT